MARSIAPSRSASRKCRRGRSTSVFPQQDQSHGAAPEGRRRVGRRARTSLHVPARRVHVRMAGRTVAQAIRRLRKGARARGHQVAPARSAESLRDLPRAPDRGADSSRHADLSRPAQALRLRAELRRRGGRRLQRGVRPQARIARRHPPDRQGQLQRPCRVLYRRSARCHVPCAVPRVCAPGVRGCRRRARTTST